MDKGVLNVYETPGLLSEAAANFMVQLAETAIAERGRFVIALSGGNTPERLYSLLATPIYRHQIDWDKTFVFWGDERCVPLDDERNNAHMARAAFLDNIGLPVVNIYPVPVNLPPADAASVYEDTLHHFFGTNQPAFDLILLGLGDNGHTASLFPHTGVLHETERWVKEVYVDEVKMDRITFTAPFINQAHNIVFLVTGKAKASMLKTVLSDNYQPNEYPAQLIQPVEGKLFWFVDKDAAQLV